MMQKQKRNGNPVERVKPFLNAFIKRYTSMITYSPSKIKGDF